MAGYTREQLDTIRRITSTPSYKAASPRERKAALEAALVESNATPIHGGDRDSSGVFQQRPSQGWGPASDSVETDTDQFLAAARKANNGRGSAGELAQRVQRSAFPGRYDQRAAEVDKLLGSRPRAKLSQRAPVVKDTPPSLVPGRTTTDTQGAVVAALLDPRKKMSLGSRIIENVQSGKYTTTTKPLVTPGKTYNVPRSAGSGTAPIVERAAKPAKGLHGSEVLELIHNDGGKGYGIKNGKVVDGASVYSAVWAGHANHVHVAAGPKTTVELGKLAQRMGLHVSENPHFGGVSPVHVQGSYHYKGQAFDASGTAKQMDAFSRAVAAYNRSHGR